MSSSSKEVLSDQTANNGKQIDEQVSEHKEKSSVAQQKSAPLLNKLLADLDKKTEATLLQPFYSIPERNLSKRVCFAVSEKYTEFQVCKKKSDKWNSVRDGLILGKIPFYHERQDIIDFALATQKPLGLVVSVVDYFELGGNIFLNDIATPRDWHDKKINHISLPMIDFEAKIPVESVIKVIDLMTECMRRGESVYVHCKAGRGRSAMICAIFMVIVDENCQDENIDKAIEKAVALIKKSRPQIELDADKTKKAKEAILLIRKLEKRKNKDDQKEEKKDDKEVVKKKTLEESLHDLLSLAETKLAISDLTFFKEIAIYAAYNSATVYGKTKRTEHIRNFFATIENAKDASWYLNYPQDKYLKDFMNAKPSLVWGNGMTSIFDSNKSTKDSKIRNELVNSFFDELTDYLARRLVCKKEELNELIKTVTLKQYHQNASPLSSKFA